MIHRVIGNFEDDSGCRRKYRQAGDCLPSDLTDPEWERLAQLIPPAKPGGRPRKIDMRSAMNAIFYLSANRLPVALLRGRRRASLVTTSGYGKASFEFANGKPIEVISSSNLLYLLREHAGVEAKIEPPEDWVDFRDSSQ